MIPGGVSICAENIIPIYCRPGFGTIRAVAQQLIMPFTIFQAIRTLIFPTTFDVILLIIFLLIACAFYLEAI